MAEHRRDLTVRDLTAENLLPAVIEGGGKRYRVQTPAQYFYALKLLGGKPFTINGLSWNPDSKITYDMLMGKNLFYLRRRITAVKNMLYSQVKDQRTLLSIGAGRGADILRWRQFDKIVLVEPNSDHIEEIKRRMEFFLDIDYKIIQARGQEADKIISETLKFMGKPDVIEFMLSLTFFDFSSREELQALGKLMRFADYILIITPDRRRMLELIKSGHKFKDMTLRLENGKVHIHIPDSIVTDQEEFLVPTNIFERLSDGEIVFKPNLMEERLMTADERKFLNTMTAMVIKR